MSNLSAFGGTFLSYLIVFLVFAGCALVAAFVGIKLRKSRDKKKALKDSAEKVDNKD